MGTRACAGHHDYPPSTQVVALEVGLTSKPLLLMLYLRCPSTRIQEAYRFPAAWTAGSHSTRSLSPPLEEVLADAITLASDGSRSALNVLATEVLEGVEYADDYREGMPKVGKP